MEDIIKIVMSLEDSGLLLKGVSETIQNEAKLLGGNLLACKRINKEGYGYKDLQFNKEKGIIRAGQGSKLKF